MKNTSNLCCRTGSKPTLLIMVITAVLMATMILSLLSSTKKIQQHTRLITVAAQIKLETTLSHLWLEELISGDKNKDIAKSWDHLDQATILAQSLLSEDSTAAETGSCLGDNKLHQEVEQLLTTINTFKSIAMKRCAAMLVSGIGTDIDHQFDSIFAKLLTQADKVEATLKQAVETDLNQFKTTQSILILFCLLLSTLCVITFFRYERRTNQQTTLLQESETRFKLFFRSVNDAIFVHPLKKEGFAPFTEINAVACSRYGYSREEFLRLSVSDITKNNSTDKFVAPELQQKLHKERTLIFESLHITKSGTVMPVEINANIIEPTKGQPLILSVVRDISERKQAETALATEKERLAVTLRSIGDGVITTDIDGKIVFLNKIAEELSGWTNDEAMGRLSTEVFNIINEKTGKKCVSPVQRVIELGRIIGLANHTALIAKDGSIRSIADSGAPIRDQNSKIIGVVIVFRDVTHEQKMTEELLKIRKLESVGVLAGGIAHDFNNILAAILGNIELAFYRIGNKDIETIALLANAKKATQRATKLTGQLLTFSKGGDPIKAETSLETLITESADFVTHGSSAICQYSFTEQLWPVDIDSGQISQVIQNIIINAKHALPEGGTITIKCDNIKDPATEALLSVDRGNYVRIQIQDQGIGIPMEIIDKIFDPYFSTKQEGSGLGLAICHSIINKHDGYITADSTPGKGTTFSIYLPANADEDILDPQEQPHQPAARAARIMLMDDEKMIRTLVQSQLTNLGHEAILAADGEQAINKYQQLQDNGKPVDVVIMDLTVPGGMGGQEAAEKLLLIDPTAKIIVASGYSNDPVMAHYADYGFCGAVAKPFDLKELNKAITSVL